MNTAGRRGYEFRVYQQRVVDNARALAATLAPERAYLQVPELRGFEVFSLGRPAEDMPQISADGLVYTIRIKKDVRYFPNPCFGRNADGSIFIVARYFRPCRS